MVSLTETRENPLTIGTRFQPYHEEGETSTRTARQSVVVIGSRPQLQQVLDTVERAYDVALLEPLEQAYPKVELESPNSIVLWLPIDERHADRTLWMVKLDDEACRMPRATREAA